MRSADIRLDRRRQIGRAFEPDRPSCRPRASAPSARSRRGGRGRACEARGSDSRRDAARSWSRGLELADQMPSGALKLEQAADSAIDGVVDARQFRSCDAQCGPYSARTRATWAAAMRPLRTALSIVAGQPVSVHVPARTTSGRPVETPGARHSGAAAIVANGSRLTRDHKSSAAPSRPVSCPAIRSTSFFPRMSSRSGNAARHDRQILTLCRQVAGERTPVEHQCASRLQQRRKRRFQERTIEPEMHAHDR